MHAPGGSCLTDRSIVQSPAAPVVAGGPCGGYGYGHGYSYGYRYAPSYGYGYGGYGCHSGGCHDQSYSAYLLFKQHPQLIKQHPDLFKTLDARQTATITQHILDTLVPLG